MEQSGATWLQIPMSGVTMPEKNRDSDIILGRYLATARSPKEEAFS